VAVATRSGSVRNGTIRTGTRPETGAKPERRSPAAVDYGTLPNHVGYLLRLAQLRVWEDFYGRLGETGVSPALFSALMLVDRNPGIQQSRLGEALGVARSGAMTMTDRLERLGLVERRADPHDRRAYGLFLTASGQRDMATYVARVQQHDTLINQVLTAEEHRTLMRLLHKFTAAPAPITLERGQQSALSAPDNDPVASRTKRPAQAGRAS
jgi:DNA-binding MarR family transcriptional regulator